MTSPTPIEQPDEELRSQVREILQSGPKNLWRGNDHDEFPVPNFEDDFVSLIESHTQKALYDQLNNILSNNYDDMHETYNYDTIAEDVFTALHELEKETPSSKLREETSNGE